MTLDCLRYVGSIEKQGVEHLFTLRISRWVGEIGEGVREIRIRDEAGAFRVIYLAKLAYAVVVLHCFQKKTQETSAKDVKLAQRRFKGLARKQP